MQELILSKFAEKIGLNTHEAYLHLEKENDRILLWVIERGTGGCTFPEMEKLAEIGDIDKVGALEDLFQEDSFFKEVLIAKSNIERENPYFYETVFKAI